MLGALVVWILLGPWWVSVRISMLEIDFYFWEGEFIPLPIEDLFRVKAKYSLALKQRLF